MTTMTARTFPATRRARLLLIAIAACFVVPLAVAAVLVQFWRPTGSGAHGDLLDTARPLPELALRQAGDTVSTRELFDQRWTLLYWLPAGCDETCEQSLYYMRQVRLALGKDADRIQTLLATDEPPVQPLSDWLAREHTAMQLTEADAGLSRFLAESFAAENAEGWIYVIDPLGNLLMRYGSSSDPGNILDDLKHLLKLSRIG